VIIDEKAVLTDTLALSEFFVLTNKQWLSGDVAYVSRALLDTLLRRGDLWDKGDTEDLLVSVAWHP
jgi:hypothetical protein